MLRYVGKRIVLMVATLFVIISVTFFISKLLPGTPFAGSGGSATARPNVDTIPWVTLLSRPSGLPITMTMSTARKSRLEPKRAGTSPAVSSTRVTARSSAG